ncbi:MAG: MoxR family ATPase [Verrucomicrobiota bacterium]
MKQKDVRTFSEQIADLDRLRTEIGNVVVGQARLIDRLIMALLSKGHVLIEGVPGLAKTLTVSTLARTFDAVFNRIQFTPDLLPGDLIGTLIYNQKSGEFTPHKGPIFAHILLADEINRSPAKVQSALLEAMQERQVSIGEETHDLEEPFMVLATQNPIEQEGTYQLPEAQLDRFFFKLTVDYPTLEEEHTIMQRMATSRPDTTVNKVFSRDDIVALRDVADSVFLKENIERYILQIVDATRHPENYGLDFGPLVRHGASPRASIFLAMASRAHAMLDGRDYVVPNDVKQIGVDVLRHRVALTYKAEAQSVTSEDLVARIFESVDVPD